MLPSFLHQKKTDYSKPVRIGTDFSNNYTEYESNGDESKTLSIKEYLNRYT